MKFEIYGENRSVEEKPVIFRLKKHPAGMQLVAVDDYGNTLRSGVILTVLLGGRIKMSIGVNPDLGFQRGPAGKVSIE